MKICSIEGCNNKHEAKTYCKKHYRSFLKYGDALFVERKRLENEKLKQEQELLKEQIRKVRSTEGTCKVIGCNKPIQSKKLCATHYSRYLRNGNLQPKHQFNEIETDACLAVNCDNPHKRHGLCTTHLINVRELKSPFRPKTIKLCGAKNCENLHYGHGLCKQHFNEWKQIVRSNQLNKYLDLKGQ